MLIRIASLGVFGPLNTFTLDTLATDPTGGGSTLALGLEFEWQHPTYGKQLVRVVKNNSGGTLAPQDCCVFQAGSRTLVEKAATVDLPRDMVAGFVPTALYNYRQESVTTVADGACFFAVVEGRTLVRTAGNVAQSSIIQTTATAGKVDDRSPVAGADIGVFEAAAGGGATDGILATVRCAKA